MMHLTSKLEEVGVRPTLHRLQLGNIIWNGDDNCHFTAEWLFQEAQAQGVRLSLATVYNTLHQFMDAKLLKEVVVDAGKSYFDTNLTIHAHWFYEDTSELVDIDMDTSNLSSIMKMPDEQPSDVQLIVRVASKE